MTPARPIAPPSRSTARLAAGGFAVMLLCAISPLTMAADSAPPHSAPLRPAPVRVATGFDWTPAQVAQLIAAIEDARRHGLDPQDYGLAALRGERELAASFWRTGGSAQLDALARAAALALAADYARASGQPQPRERLAAAIEDARRAGTLRSWLATQAKA